jgi:hypothetical protein
MPNIEDDRIHFFMRDVAMFCLVETLGGEA